MTFIAWILFSSNQLIKGVYMDFDNNFTVICDEYIVVDKDDGQLFFWSSSLPECLTFCRVNSHLNVILLYV